MVRTSSLFAVLLALVLGAAGAFAQGTARSMDFNVSIRSSALGNASNALFWGQGIDHYGNPALLAYVQGIRFEHGETPLIPELDADITFKSDVVKVGVPGAGIVFSGTPFPDGVILDYGSSEGTDPSGNPTGTFGSHESVESWGFGVSPVRLIEAALRLAGNEPADAWSRLDASFGMNFKEVFIQLAPTDGTGSTSAQDWGVFVRLTPVDLRSKDTVIPTRIDLAYGYSVLSYNDDAIITFVNSAPSPVSRHERHGAAFRASFDHPRLLNPDPSTWAWFLKGLSPLVTVGVTTDRATIGAGGLDEGYDVSGYGFEADIANVAALRVGHYSDRDDEINDRTWGFAVGLPIGRFGGVRYEESWFPMSEDSGLAHQHRKGFSAWFDPLALRK